MTPDEHLTEAEAILESVDDDDYDTVEIDSLNLSAIAHGVAGLLKLQIEARVQHQNIHVGNYNDYFKALGNKTDE